MDFTENLRDAVCEMIRGMSRRWNTYRVLKRYSASSAPNPDSSAQNRLSVEGDRLSWGRDDMRSSLTLLESTIFPAAIFVLLVLPVVMIFGIITLVQLLLGSFKGFGDDLFRIAFISGFCAFMALAFWALFLMMTESKRFSFDVPTGTLSFWEVRIGRRPVETLVPFEAIVELYPEFMTTYDKEGAYRVRFKKGARTEEVMLGTKLASDDLERMSAWLRPVFGERVGEEVRHDS